MASKREKRNLKEEESCWRGRENEVKEEKKAAGGPGGRLHKFEANICLFFAVSWTT